MSRHKYNVATPDRRRWRDKTYDSRAEMLYAKHLDALIETANLTDFCEQPQVMLGEDTRWRLDFFVVGIGREMYYVDVKGRETPDFRRKKKLWQKYGRLPLHIVKLKGKRFETVEIVERQYKETTECKQ